MARRGRMQIIADILEVASDEAGKTRIVYGANLNFKLLEKILPTLIDRGLIEQVGAGYKTTDKGRTYLKNYRDAVKLLR